MTVTTPTAVPAPRAEASATCTAGGLRAPLATVRRTPLWLARTPVLALLAWWGWFAVQGTGGRDTGAVLPLAALAAVACGVEVLLRGLSTRVAIWLITAAAAPLGVCAVAPTAWSGVQTAMSYVVAATTAVAVLSFSRRDPAAPQVLVGAFLAAGVLQFASALTPWWGHEDPAAAMIGTFYWHDAFAAWMLAPAVLAFAVISHPAGWSRLIRPLAWCAAILCPVGVVLSTSRAAMACLVVGLVLTVAPLVLRAGRRGLARVIGAAAGSGLFQFLLTGPPLFPHRASAFAGTAARAAAGETLSQNSSYRVQFWHEALSLWHRFPLSGGGFGSLADGSVGRTPTGWALTPYAHEGYLQVLSDGGLLLAAPFAVALALIGSRLLRIARGASPAGRSTSIEIALGGALCALLAHSLVDIDTSFPVLLAAIGLLGGAVIATASGERPRSRRPAAIAVAAVALATAFGAWATTLVRHDARLVRRIPVATGAQPPALRAALSPVLADPEAARTALLAAVGREPGGPLLLDPISARAAVSRTARLARLDARVVVVRARVLARLGDQADARAVLDEVRSSGLIRSAGLDLDLALLADDVGETETARGIASTGLLQALGYSPASASFLADQLIRLGNVGPACATDLPELASGARSTVTPPCRSLLSIVAAEVRQ